MAKQVIINGDDFGYSPGVNQGIITAYSEGILTSTTALANCLAGNETLNQLSAKFKKPPIGIGVHLNLTLGKPLAPEVWKEKEFVRPHKGSNKPEEWQGSAWQSYFSALSDESIRKEFEKQIAYTREVLGSIDHLDSHHGVTSYTPVVDVYFELAKKFHLALRPTSPMSENAIYGGEFMVNNDFAKEVRSKQIKTVDRVVMTYFYRAKDPESEFCNVLETIKEGELVEFMFHPATDDSRGAWRMIDLKILTSKKVKQKIVDLGIKLSTYTSGY